MVGHLDSVGRYRQKMHDIEQLHASDEQVAEANREKRRAEEREVVLKEKAMGNDAFKAQRFAEAIGHYSAAIDLDFVRRCSNPRCTITTAHRVLGRRCA